MLWTYSGDGECRLYIYLTLVADTSEHVFKCRCRARKVKFSVRAKHGSVLFMRYGFPGGPNVSLP